MSMLSRYDIYTAAFECLSLSDPEKKAKQTRFYAQQWRDGVLGSLSKKMPVAIAEAGHPKKPKLISPREVPKRSLGTLEGQAALIHAIAHIEFNAINLAWDAVYRFRDMPEQYLHDWVRVADEEAYHYGLVCGCLNDLGYRYGDFDAHDGLWDMAQRTAHDVLERMALVPRVMEARGLDVTPGISRRFKAIGNNDMVRVLGIILRDEIGHVAVGSRWFHYCCKQRNLDPNVTFQTLLHKYLKGKLRGPFSYEARLQAGFDMEELKQLEAMN
ncbi:MAG: ferritin-like domain-containing protein [Gammaproteobacteria bacterium]|nr:ferritin-like domain-containing protein [Gammaproteobacteria bacterium]